MATEFVTNNIEKVRASVRASFSKIYAALKARELKTLRQLEAVQKQFEENLVMNRNCVQNIEISYENESILLDCINNYGVIDVEKLNFDSNIFSMEDYISPNEDHMYMCKNINELLTEDKDLHSVEEAALKEVTKTGNCVCYVNIQSDQVSKQFKEPTINSVKGAQEDNICSNHSNILMEIPGNVSEESGNLDSEMEIVKKVEPTDDWLNTIKDQTETEPTQIVDVMEHSKIACL